MCPKLWVTIVNKRPEASRVSFVKIAQYAAEKDRIPKASAQSEDYGIRMDPLFALTLAFYPGKGVEQGCIVGGFIHHNSSRRLGVIS